MKTRLPASRLHAAFTMVEVLICLAVLFVLVGLLLPALARPKINSSRINCVNNLKQVGLAFRIWANDNDGLFPAQVAVTNGGTAEGAAEVWRSIQFMSNELGATKIILCRSDERQPPDSWTTLANTNISYFIGLEARETNPMMLLAGDRNLTNGRPVQNGILTIATNDNLGWTHEIHRNAGNIAMADGSVQQTTSLKLRESIRNSGATNGVVRLAMPE